ncbi:MAG TPA: hypothetical protein VF099_14590 [Ktedonobacterales bacterium]
MLFYRLALFIHVMGALTLFIAVGLNFASMLRMRQARTIERLAEWARLGLLAGRMIPVAILFISGGAIYMVTVAWGWQTAWVDVVLATFIGHAVVVQAIENPRLSKLHKGALKAPEGPVPLDLHLLANDGLMWTADLTVTTTTVGMIFLMSVKPDLVISLVAIGVTLLAGLALSMPFWQTTRARVRVTQSGRLAS